MKTEVTNKPHNDEDYRYVIKYVSHFLNYFFNNLVKAVPSAILPANYQPGFQMGK